MSLWIFISLFCCSFWHLLSWDYMCEYSWVCIDAECSLLCNLVKCLCVQLLTIHELSFWIFNYALVQLLNVHDFYLLNKHEVRYWIFLIYQLNICGFRCWMFWRSTVQSKCSSSIIVLCMGVIMFLLSLQKLLPWLIWSSILPLLP